MDWIYLLIPITLVLYLWYRRQKTRMTFLKRIGIPGPPPEFIRGNMKEIDQKGLGDCHKEWIEKYGKIIGYYIGSRPVVLVADIELLKLIQIKHFSNFSDRKHIIPGGTLPTIRPLRSLITDKGVEWKESRSILSPTFTSGKLKYMHIIMERCITEFSDLIKNQLKSTDIINIHSLYTNLTMDILARIAFGIRTDVQHNEKSPFVTDSKEALRYSLSNISIRAIMYFPDIIFVISPLRVFLDYIRYFCNLSSTVGLYKSCLQVITARRKQSQNTSDLLQLMIDSKISENQMKSLDTQNLTADGALEKEIPKDGDSGKSPDTNWRSMTDLQIQSNAVLFLLAGHHTTSTCLSYTTFLLSTHQDIQDKLRDEIRNCIQEKGELNYEDVMKLPYLDQVISESLRIYPPVISFVTRESKKEFRYKQYLFPARTLIQAAVYPLHSDPDFWENPEKFNPERFSPENKSKIGLFYQPFGAGPRNCIGMRFALLEVKLALATLISNYHILPCSKTNLKIEFKISVTNVESGMEVKLVPV